MAPLRLQAIIWVSITAFVAGGCHRGSADDTPVATDPKTYIPSEASPNAFDAYALAALDAEAKGGKALSRVSFYPGEKKKAAEEIASAVSKVIAASKSPCEFKFTPHKPFQLVPYQMGWRLIGHVIVWQVESDCTAGDFDKAVTAAIAGTRFGFGLTGGGATDASLGLAIADEIRRAIAPSLIKMSAVQLDRLGRGMKSALESKPPISTAVTNEEGNTMLMIKALEDAAKSDQLKVMRTNFGPDSNEAIQRLDEIAGNDNKRHAYFGSLTSAAKDETKAVIADSESPASKWDLDPPKIDAPWRKLAKQVYGAARPLLAINDATVARTRLLVLYAEVTRIWLRTKEYPAKLTGFSEPLTTDPYSGKPFIYFKDPAQFKIYSVGMNGLDDGGDTDDTFTKPDLRLELPNQQ